MTGGIAYAQLVIERNIRRLEMRKHVIAAATATMFCIAAIGAAVAARDRDKDIPDQLGKPAANSSAGVGR
jgi:hypothetical protein